jgi:hypothetical protein
LSIPNVSAVPSVWSDEELTSQAQLSLDAFRARRLAEPTTRYPEILGQEKQAVCKLIRLMSVVNPNDPDPLALRKIWADAKVFDVLRYVAGPPISLDDLGVLVTSGTAKLSKSRLSRSDELARATLAMICQLTDDSRFPWVKDQRKATLQEIKRAVYATASLRATQLLATERRGYGRKVELALCDALIARGFQRLAAPNGGKILTPNQHPAPGTFYPECSLRARKTDLLIGLSDGRSVAVEAKDSGSVINSVKRVLNDTAAKAQYWHSQFATTVVPVALLSGVFGVENLKSAQEHGLYLVWTHDLEGFVTWLEAS